jgi:iron-sulfur cluster assembly protein
MITITKAAADTVIKQLARRGHGQGIRIGIKTTGCSGFAYVLEYVDTPAVGDQCIEYEGCKVFVDPKSQVYLDSMEIDYVRNGLNEGFQFNNPNEKDRCGCGESFRI